MKTKIQAAIVAAAALFLSGCVSQFISDMNDPNRVTDAPQQQVPTVGPMGTMHPPPPTPPTSSFIPSSGSH
jgi:PBP1b-binding outer membrane lipoprotein LpoB